MGQQISLTGDDTVILAAGANQILVNDFAIGVVAEITFPENLVKVTRGKNGNTVFALNNQGFQSEVKLKVLLGKNTDTFLNAQMAAMQQAFSGYVLLTGTFIKNVGDGLGNITPVTYIMSGGVAMKNPMAQSVAEGVPEQSLVEWDLIFANNKRTIG
jgi:hypothetical protein